jgi:hypothetical protein
VNSLALLAARTGRYGGRGTDHTGEEFAAEIIVGVVAGGAAVTLDATTTGPGGEIQHDEHGVLAAGEDGTVRYTTVTSNARFHRVFALRRTERDGDATRAVFGWGGEPADLTGFRDELTLTAYADGDLGLGWAWGLPGQPFAPRSGVRLRRLPG